ncbi:CopG family transcriptional regulator [Sphingomonas bacterium]|uniref:ribbon-helix-helix domain-containing protein n=1 Tax=Sphingomonas bacterium TaxID=1895847 RepID=UPI001575277F|nr:CopG family transcriptional regulator [Sphingomonas bacterium]
MATDAEKAAEPAPGDLQTATLKLPAETLDFLRESAKKRGVSTGDMVRIALGTQKFLSEAVEGGATVQLKGRGGLRDVAI